MVEFYTLRDRTITPVYCYGESPPRVLTTLDTDSIINFRDSMTTTGTQTTVLNIPDCIPHAKVKVPEPSMASISHELYITI